MAADGEADRKNPMGRIPWDKWFDHPLDSPAEDTLWGDLSLNDEATALVDTVVSEAGGKASSAYGLHGPYGAGKTSLLQIVMGRLRDALEEARLSHRIFEYQASRAEVGGTPPVEMLAQALANDPAHPHPSLKVFAESAGEQGVWERVVWCIDDLDRCRHPEHVLGALQMTRAWDRPGWHFILVGDMACFLRAIGAAGYAEGAARGVALEKYLHRSLFIPPLNDLQLRTYMHGLLQEDDPAVRNGIVPLLDLLVLGLASRTPRSAKRILRAILPLVRWHVASAAPASPLSLAVKERVLANTWPDFHEHCFSRGVVAGEEPIAAIFTVIEEAAARRVPWSFAAALAELGRVGPWVPDAAATRGLEAFLAHEPYWTVPAAPAGRAGEAAPQVSPSGGQPRAPVGTLLQASADVAAIRDLALQIDIADELGERRRVAGMSRDLAARVAAAGGGLQRSDAPRLGNAAVIAEHAREYEAAAVLYGVTVTLDPGHANNLQNCVSFILDTRRTQDYDTAERLLNDLSTDTAMAAWRPLRTDLLRAQLAYARQPSEVSAHTYLRVLEGAAQADDIQGWQNGFAAAGAMAEHIRDVDAWRDVAWAWWRRVAGNDEDEYFVARALADNLAESNAADDELEAMEVYRRIEVDRQAGRYRGRRASDKAMWAAELNNYASLLRNHGFPRAALRRAARAYALNGGDTRVQALLVRVLVALQLPELAARAGAGAPLDVDPGDLPADEPMQGPWTERTALDAPSAPGPA